MRSTPASPRPPPASHAGSRAPKTSAMRTPRGRTRCIRARSSSDGAGVYWRRGGAPTLGAMKSLLSAAELLRTRSDPAASEALSPLFGAQPLCVDLGVEPPEAGHGERAWAWLAELPAVSVGVARAGVAP